MSRIFKPFIKYKQERYSIVFFTLLKNEEEKPDFSLFLGSANHANWLI